VRDYEPVTRLVERLWYLLLTAVPSRCRPTMHASAMNVMSSAGLRQILTGVFAEQSNEQPSHRVPPLPALNEQRRAHDVIHRVPVAGSCVRAGRTGRARRADAPPPHVRPNLSPGYGWANETKLLVRRAGGPSTSSPILRLH
jgi:hypothetical protein